MQPHAKHECYARFFTPQQAPQRVIKTRREYNIWVADESIEDYAPATHPPRYVSGRLGR